MKKRSKKRKNPLTRVRNQTNYFMPGKAQTLEQFIIASMVQGAFTAAGAVLGTILAKYFIKEADSIIPLPQSLHAAINKEAS
jgi:hypothetical protein